MNHYLVYTLTRAAALESTAAERARFEALRSRVEDDVAEAALQEVLGQRG